MLNLWEHNYINTINTIMREQMNKQYKNNVNVLKSKF